MKQESSQENDTTHFGYQEVPKSDKARKVAEVFHSVASRYDLMNDLMSMGAHRLWKRFAIQQSEVGPGDRVLDVAGGTGDLTALFSSRVGRDGRVVLSDINNSMLNVGRDRLMDRGVAGKIEFIQADAQSLPFEDNSFDCISIGFGLRNVTDKDAALRSMYRVLKPGGRLLILEFSRPSFPGLDNIYDWYSFNVIPKIGKLVTDDEASYKYLVESIRKHPDQETLKNMMEQAGFNKTAYFNLSGGIVALHKGTKSR